MDKVQRVLEGKAVLKVVDVDGPAASTPELGLEEKMGAMNIGSASGTGSPKQQQSPPVWGCAGQRRSTTMESWVGGATEKKRILGS